MIDGTSVRIALRTLGRHRGFAAVAILSIASAIALNTTMYSIADAMLDPNIKARRPDLIYKLQYFGDRRHQLSRGAIESALAAGMHSYEGVTGAKAYARGRRPIAENGSRYREVMFPEVVRPNYFQFLGTPAIAGRVFTEADVVEGQRLAVISDRLAQQLYLDASPVGQTFRLDDSVYTVIGVVERNTSFEPLSRDVWLLPHPGEPDIPMSLIRFRDKVEKEVVGAELAVVATRLAFAAGELPSETRFYPKGLAIKRYTLFGFHWALVGGVVAILLVACANLANLQLARGLARSRELAVRAAVGASRRQLFELLVTESAILAVAGLALGLVMALWGIELVRATIPDEMLGMLVEPQTSWRVFVFAAVACVACIVLIGMLPAIQVSRADPNSLLKSGSGTGANKANRRRYGYMVAAQIGLALPVLIAGVAMLKSAITLQDPQWLSTNWYGFNPKPLVSATVPIVGNGKKRQSLYALASELRAVARSAEGVVDAAVSSYRVPDGKLVTVDDADGALREEMAHQWYYRIVTPGWLKTTGFRMERGRDFTENELDASPVIIDNSTATFLWKAEDPIGRAIKFGDGKSKADWHRVVGVFKDQRDSFAIRRVFPDANFRLNLVYRLITPEDSITPLASGTNVLFYARVNGSTQLGALRVQRALRAVSWAGKPSVRPLLDNDSWGTSRTNFLTSLLNTFAAVGVCLMIIGVYGIVQHSVAERYRELAVRISLGASTTDVLRAVLREGNVVLLAGTAIGLYLTKRTIFWISGFMVNDIGYNALLFAGIAAGLFAVAVVAAGVPAWRATRIDPAHALRND